MPKRVADNELMVMARLADLYATLTPERRHRVHEYMGERLDSLPVIAEIKDPEPVPMFPDHEERERERAKRAAE